MAVRSVGAELRRSVTMHSCGERDERDKEKSGRSKL